MVTVMAHFLNFTGALLCDWHLLNEGLAVHTLPIISISALAVRPLYPLFVSLSIH